TRELPRSLGLRLAGEGNADAVVRGRIVRYNDDANVYATGQQGNIDVQQHQVEITVAIEVVDIRNNVILWDSQSLVGRGQYRQQTQEPGIAEVQAIESLRQQIIDGMQSQW
ncbi:MAG: LPS assembly lipoprotein LptE, partial [Longimicrobiales bacterium]